MATIEQLVGRYIEIRDKKDEIRKAYNAKVAKLDDAMNKLEAVLLASFDSAGVDSTKTKSGTAYISARKSFTVADRDAFLDCVREENAWELLEARCSKLAAEQFLEATGKLPDGVNYRAERTINVQRPRIRAA